MTPAQQVEFIRRETRLHCVPHAPEIRLNLADEAVALWQRTEEDLAATGLPPPFWAFAWAGGQALARHVLDEPQLVAGRTVLDVASGSGLVGIAAALAGAAEVHANDVDAFALAAIALNAAENGVAARVRATGGDLVGRDDGWDVVLAGDIFYERDTASRMLDWLKRLHARGALVLMGDPGRAYLPRDGLIEVAIYCVPTLRSLEDHAIKRTSVWRFA